ncbi:MAG: AAA family ATPase [bacterium]|nr:AAA family ATPase [bacterium]
MHLKTVTLNPKLYPTTDHYPFNLDLFQKSQKITFESPVTFFVGENGSGKSTLLEAITRKCGIYIWQGMQRPRFNASPHEKGLFKTIAIEWIDGKKVPGSFFGSQIFNNFAQFIIATHSPILLACPTARIFSFDDIPVRPIDYNKTNHYRIYKDFMKDPQKYLQEN